MCFLNVKAFEQFLVDTHKNKYDPDDEHNVLVIWTTIYKMLGLQMFIHLVNSLFDGFFLFGSNIIHTFKSWPTCVIFVPLAAKSLHL